MQNGFRFISRFSRFQDQRRKVAKLGRKTRKKKFSSHWKSIEICDCEWTLAIKNYTRYFIFFQFLLLMLSCKNRTVISLSFSSSFNLRNVFCCCLRFGICRLRKIFNIFFTFFGSFVSILESTTPIMSLTFQITNFVAKCVDYFPISDWFLISAIITKVRTEEILLFTSLIENRNSLTVNCSRHRP